MRVVFSPKSLRNLEEIADYISLRNPQRALSYVRELRLFCEKLQTMPRSYPLIEGYGKDVRKTVFGRYLIFYRVLDDNTLRIEHIRHSARQDDVTLH